MGEVSRLARIDEVQGGGEGGLRHSDSAGRCGVWKRSLGTVGGEGLKFRRRVLYGLEGAMYWSGAAGAYVKLRKVRGAIILMYHSVARAGESRWIDPQNRTAVAMFSRQMAFLARHRRVVAMSELLDLLERGKTPRAGTVVLTFDDGYLDNLLVAAPILDSLRLAAILYLPTGYVGRSEAQWIDELYTMFMTASRPQLELDGPVSRRFDLREVGGRRVAYSELTKCLISSLPDQRRQILSGVSDQLRPTHRPPQLTMNWDDVRQMRKEFPNFEIGVHTAEHLDLTTHDGDIARQELRRCIEDVERELGERPKHFAFPYSRSSAPTRKLVRELGLRSAVAMGSDVVVTARSDCCALSRIEAPRSMTLFRFFTSGAYPGLPQALVGRA